MDFKVQKQAVGYQNKELGQTIRLEVGETLTEEIAEKFFSKVTISRLKKAGILVPLGSVVADTSDDQTDDQPPSGDDDQTPAYTRQELSKKKVDQLIVIASELGLSEGRDLTAIKKPELVQLILAESEAE